MSTTQDFDKPLPQSRSGHDFAASPLRTAKQIDYYAARLDGPGLSAFRAGRIANDDITRGFAYWDKEARERKFIPKMTMWVIDVLFGSFSNGKNASDIRYSSNLVSDTRTDIMQSSYFIQSDRRTLAIGNYRNDIVPALKAEGRNGGFTTVIIAHVPEMGGTCAIHLSAIAEAAFCKAVAEARGVKERAGSLMGLCEFDTQTWVFEFAGEFEMVTLPNDRNSNTPRTIPDTGSAPAIFSQPKTAARVALTTNPKLGERSQKIQDKAKELREYLRSEQDYLRGIVEKNSAFNGNAQQEHTAPAPNVTYSNAQVNTNVRANNEPRDPMFEAVLEEATKRQAQAQAQRPVVAPPPDMSAAPDDLPF